MISDMYKINPENQIQNRYDANSDYLYRLVEIVLEILSIGRARLISHFKPIFVSIHK